MIKYRLGRLPAEPVDVGDLTYYLTEPLPVPPPEVQAPALSYPMACNNSIGDCTIAAAVHSDQVTASLTDEPWTYPGDSTVSAEYFDLTGGQDTGLVEARVLKAWHAVPGLFGHELAAFAPLAVKHTTAIRQAVNLDAVVYTGVLIPAPAEQQFQDGQPWALTGTSADSDIEGGHAVPIAGYNPTGPVVVTWGALQQVTWQWWLEYAEEAYALLTAEVKLRGSLGGIAFDALDKDLAALHAA